MIISWTLVLMFHAFGGNIALIEIDRTYEYIIDEQFTTTANVVTHFEDNAEEFSDNGTKIRSTIATKVILAMEFRCRFLSTASSVSFHISASAVS